jgi:hypothetical protein
MNLVVSMMNEISSGGEAISILERQCSGLSHCTSLPETALYVWSHALSLTWLPGLWGVNRILIDNSWVQLKTLQSRVYRRCL